MKMTSHGNSYYPEFRVGQHLMVTIEQVFDGGVVVSYEDKKSGWRGALLGMPTPFCQPILESEKDMANPLSMIHDHRYANLEKFARHLASKVPSEVLLNWNMVPKVSCGHILCRRTSKANLLQQVENADSRFCKWRTSTIESVEITPPKSNGYNVKGAHVRLAKVLASHRIKKDVTLLNRKNCGPITPRRSIEQTGSRVRLFKQNLSSNDGSSISASNDGEMFPGQSAFDCLHNSIPMKRNSARQRFTPSPLNFSICPAHKRKLRMKKFRIEVTRITDAELYDSSAITDSLSKQSPLEECSFSDSSDSGSSCY